MIESLLANLETLLLYLFAACALAGAVLMLVLRQPMRVAMALISTMVFLGGVYGLLGVHFIAAFQVLIYVGAVMVFMVYVIMLLDPRDPALARRFSSLLIPGVLACVALFAVFVTLAVLKRRDSQRHKRFMLLATISMLGAAFARWPGVSDMGPPVFFGLTDLFIVALAVWDFRSRGKLHSATLWGGLAIVVCEALSLMIMGTPGWIAFATWATGLAR